jgi:capsular exopolysaccharide synthesis family protein
MELQRYVRVLISRKWVVILTTIVTLAVVVLGSILMTPIYSASALVRVTAGLNGSVTYTDLNYTERLIETYVQLLKSRPFLGEAIKQLNLQVRTEALADTIRVDSLTGTELIKISVESISPLQAAAIANTLATLLVEQGEKMYYGQGKGAREIIQEQLTASEDQLRQDRALLASLSASTPSPNQTGEASRQDLTAKITSEEQTYAMLLNEYDKARIDEAMRANSVGIVEPAIEPEAPSKPNLKLNIALGAMVGLMSGIGLAFLFENLSPLIRSRNDLEKTAGVPVLGRIPEFEIRAGDREKPILLNDGNAPSPAAEAFRVLSASTSVLVSKAHLKTILFSSAGPGAGKSTILANLAIAMAEAGRQVIVVDGDLRHPVLHRIFDVAAEPGLSDLLLDPSRLDSVIQPTRTKRIRAIAAGSAQNGPALLYAPVISKIMRQLAKDADIVLWDSPPVLAAADAALLAPMADGVVLVVDRSQTQQQAVQAACQELEDVKSKLIGIIVNRVKKDSRYNYYYQRPLRDSSWAGMLKGIRNVNLGFRGSEIFNGKKK